MKEEYQDRIDNYLLGRMSEAERVSFERDLNLDDKLKEQYEFTKAVKNALMMEKIEEDISRWDQEYVKEKSKKPKSQRRVFYWISGIAAVFVVGFFLFNKYSGAEDAFSVPNVHRSFPSSSESYRGSMEIIEQMLQNKDFNSALNAIDEHEHIINNEKMKNDEEKSFGKISQDEYEQIREILQLEMNKLMWFRAQALIGINRMSEAIRLLDEIRHSDSDYQQWADSVYNNLMK